MITRISHVAKQIGEGGDPSTQDLYLAMEEHKQAAEDYKVVQEYVRARLQALPFALSPAIRLGRPQVRYKVEDTVSALKQFEGLGMGSASDVIAIWKPSLVPFETVSGMARPEVIAALGPLVKSHKIAPAIKLARRT